MAAKKRWARFPHDQKPFDYAGDALKKAWKSLHAGDLETWPDEKVVAARLKRNPDLGKDAARIARALAQAWRDFHRGEFQAACEAGLALGPLGASVACKAGGIHAVHLLEDEKARNERFAQLAGFASDAAQAMPWEANAHFRHAFALGRYGQGISIAKALAQGLAGRIRASLDHTLELEPDHAEAHTALGLYHAEIVAKVGAMIGALTYGAKAGDGERHLRRAVELTPEAPIARIECGNGLMLLYGEKAEDEAAELYEQATKIAPRDAMEKLDVEFARSQLED
ncbi:MAG TPA: hypothetical protein VFG21_05785 [Xanthomonadaceae bacterium]|nr:hypothetical protein [Xanthomonadaceae bacterium]